MSRLLAKFINRVVKYGLEDYGRYYSCYRGFVADNNDPDYMGRLKINVPELHGSSIPDYWAWSKGVYAGNGEGFYVLPKKGEAIWVSFEAGDPSKPIWEYGWWGKNESPKTGRVKDMTNAVYQSGGHRLEFDEKEERVRITNKAGFVIEMNKSGISIGKNTKGDEPAVLGDTLEKLLDDILQGLIDAKTMTMLGSMPLINVATFAELKEIVKNIKSSTLTIIK